MFSFSHLSASLKSGTPIVKDAELQVSPGEVHAIMGPNGSGKSTLALALAGQYDLDVTGQITLDQKQISDLEPDQRAQAGLMLSFQHPVAIPGVKISTFLRTALNTQREARGEKPVELTVFLTELREAMTTLGLDPLFASRAVNDGFSGGERKRLELVQALILKPKVLILDEIDSGLDSDAIKTVAAAITKLKDAGTVIIIITHYRRILDFLAPDQVHLFANGTFQKHGGLELVEAVERSSYEAVLNG